MTWPMTGVRPRPPPTRTRKPTSPFSSRTACTPMSCTSVAARSIARSRHRDLELARQIGELRVECRPLPDQFGVRPRIDDLVAGDAGEMVARDVADAIAAGLDRVHLDGGELREDVGHVFESRPVELDVLARREVSVASVILAADMRQLAQAESTTEGRRESQPAASAHTSGCTGRCAGAADGTRPRSARRQEIAASGRETGRRVRRQAAWSMLVVAIHVAAMDGTNRRVVSLIYKRKPLPAIK